MRFEKKPYNCFENRIPGHLSNYNHLLFISKMLQLSILFNPLERLSKPINIINQSEWSKKIVDRISTKASLSTGKSEANPTRLLKLFDMLAERNNTKNKKFVVSNIFKKHIFRHI